MPKSKMSLIYAAAIHVKGEAGKATMALLEFETIMADCQKKWYLEFTRTKDKSSWEKSWKTFAASGALDALTHRDTTQVATAKEKMQ